MKKSFFIILVSLAGLNGKVYSLYGTTDFSKDFKKCSLQINQEQLSAIANNSKRDISTNFEKARLVQIILLKTFRNYESIYKNSASKIKLTEVLKKEDSTISGILGDFGLAYEDWKGEKAVFLNIKMNGEPGKKEIITPNELTDRSFYQNSDISLKDSHIFQYSDSLSLRIIPGPFASESKYDRYQNKINFSCTYTVTQPQPNENNSFFSFHQSCKGEGVDIHPSFSSIVSNLDSNIFIKIPVFSESLILDLDYSVSINDESSDETKKALSEVTGQSEMINNRYSPKDFFGSFFTHFFTNIIGSIPSIDFPLNRDVDITQALDQNCKG